MNKHVEINIFNLDDDALDKLQIIQDELSARDKEDTMVLAQIYPIAIDGVKVEGLQIKAAHIDNATAKKVQAIIMEAQS